MTRLFLFSFNEGGIEGLPVPAALMWFRLSVDAAASHTFVCDLVAGLGKGRRPALFGLHKAEAARVCVCVPCLAHKHPNVFFSGAAGQAWRRCGHFTVNDQCLPGVERPSGHRGLNDGSI